MKHANTIIFENWDEVSEKVTENMKVYGKGIENVSVFKDVSKTLMVSMIAKKIPQPVMALIDIKAECLSDYEGIDDKTKKVGYTFPAEKCGKLLEDALGYLGYFKEIKSREVDPVSGDPMTEILYICEQENSGDTATSIAEHIECAINIISKDDEKEVIIETAYDAFSSIAAVLGNTTLADEVVNMKIDAMM